MEVLQENGVNENEQSDIAEPNDSPVAGSTRRDVLRQGAKLAWVAPVVSTFYASQAYAANYSCYAAGHACPGNETCCAGLMCNGGTCGDPCVPAGGFCFGDPDCCSGDCAAGVCKLAKSSPP